MIQYAELHIFLYLILISKNLPNMSIYLDPSVLQNKQFDIQQLCNDTGCNPEDLPEAMNDRETWRERGQGYPC